MGLSCGNPVAIATIKEVCRGLTLFQKGLNCLRQGETVVDLGSGGGIDVLLAADKVGPTGQAIGLDMSSVRLQKSNSTTDY